MKKVPERTCVVSHEELPKNELIRVVRTSEKTVIIDTTGKANGRGAYLKKAKEVIEKAKKTKILERHLEVEIPNEVFDELLKMC